MIKFTYHTSKEGENNKCNVKYVFWKVLRTLKLLTSPFLVMLQTSFTQWALKGKLGTSRAFQGHSQVTLGYSDTRRELETFRHLGTGGTRALKALGYLGTWVLEGHSGTQALEPLYLADSPVSKTNHQKHLGLHLDSKLSFDIHIKIILTIVNRTIGLLRKF